MFLGAVTGSVAAALQARAKSRHQPLPSSGTSAPTWPPLQPTSTPASTTLPAEPSATGTGWVEPVDGACPASHPVKGNAQSGIYHVPGGRFYERTRPERCYVDAVAAEADGFRAAKGAGQS